MRRSKPEAAPAAPAAPAKAEAKTPPPSTPPRELPPNRETPREAVTAAAALIATHGATFTIRALDIALLEANLQAIDVVEGVRLQAMRRRVAR